jgi:hypothetical protein
VASVVKVLTILSMRTKLFCFLWDGHVGFKRVCLPTQLVLRGRNLYYRGTPCYQVKFAMYLACTAHSSMDASLAFQVSCSAGGFQSMLQHEAWRAGCQSYRRQTAFEKPHHKLEDKSAFQHSRPFLSWRAGPEIVKQVELWQEFIFLCSSYSSAGPPNYAHGH